MPPGVDVPAVVEELRSLAGERLGERLDRMLDGADDLLFEMSERANTNAEVRIFFDTMRALRLDRQRLADAFRGAIAASFDSAGDSVPALSDDITLDELTLQDSRSVEQAIAVANMEAKAAGLYKQPLWELHRRLLTLTVEAPGLSAEALSPGAICKAFQQSADTLDFEFEIELILYKLFDRCLIADLGPLYAEVLALLEARGVRPQQPQKPRAAAAPVRPNRLAADGVPGTDEAPLESSPAFPGGMSYGAPAGMAATPGMAGAGYGAAPGSGYAAGGGTAGVMTQGFGGRAVPPLDPRTFGLLQNVAGNFSATPLEYSDANLAADLANAAQGRPVFGMAAPQAHAVAQRTHLIGRMFNELVDDPNLPDGIGPQLDALRFGVIKSALIDPGFFAKADHPVRGLINELATLAVTARRDDGGATLAGIGDLIRSVARQIEQPSIAVRNARAQAVPLSGEHADRFFEQQQQQSRARRQAVIAKVREVVEAELRLRTTGVTLPAAAEALLKSGWSTMMAYHLIRENRGAWDTGLLLLDRLVAMLDPERPEEREPGLRATLRDDLLGALRGVGLPGPRVESMVEGLDAAVMAMDAEYEDDAVIPAPVAPPTVEQVQADKQSTMMELLFVAGRWFHVYDDARSEKRWLKLLRISTAEGATFTEFNGKDPLTLSAPDTFSNLLARRIEPIDAPPAARQMLDTLIARHERA